MSAVSRFVVQLSSSISSGALYPQEPSQFLLNFTATLVSAKASSLAYSPAQYIDVCFFYKAHLLQGKKP